jgi:hypothetical protein
MYNITAQITVVIIWPPKESGNPKCLRGFEALRGAPNVPVNLVTRSAGSCSPTDLPLEL